MATRGFTPASGQDVFCIEPSERLSPSTSSALSGREAKIFYENLTRDDARGNGSTGVLRPEGGGSTRRSQRSRESRNSRRRVRETRRVQPAGASEAAVGDDEGQSNQTERAENNAGHGGERSAELQGLRLLRCAHNGDIAGLKDLLRRGADVNFQVRP